MIINNVEEEFKLSSQDPVKKQELMDFAKELWNEVIGMEKLESDPNYFGDNGDDEEEFDPWYDIATEELLLEEEADNSKK